MQQWVTVDRATVGASEFVLARRGEEWVVRVGHHVLMSNRVHQSEIALAEESIALASNPKHMLIGGLGLGFTLRAALDRLSSTAIVTVAELVPELVDWNRRHLTHLHDDALADPRTRIVVGDAFDVLERSRAGFDVVTLDVDNGPTAVSQPANRRLYGDAGLKVCAAALSPGGVLAVWSAGPDEAYVARMARAGFTTRVVRTPVRKGARAVHVLFLGTKRC